MYIWLTSSQLLASSDTVITCPCFRAALIHSLYWSSLRWERVGAMNSAWSGGAAGSNDQADESASTSKLSG